MLRLCFQSTMFASPVKWKSLLNIYYLSGLSVDIKTFFLPIAFPKCWKSAVDDGCVICEILPR